MSFRAVFLTLTLLFVSFVMQRLNQYGWLAGLQVPWVHLSVAFIVLQAPARFGLLAALIIGLLLDVENMQLLGFNMFGLTVLVVSLRLFHHRLMLAGWPLVILTVPVLALIVRWLGYGILWLLGVDVAFDFWWPLLALFIVWPLQYAILQTVRIKLNLN